MIVSATNNKARFVVTLEERLMLFDDNIAQECDR